MNLTKEEKAKYEGYNRAYNLYSPRPTTYDAKAAKQRKKEEEDKKKRTEKLLTRLGQLKKSAIKRGMYNQKTYQAQVEKESQNV